MQFSNIIVKCKTKSATADSAKQGFLLIKYEKKKYIYKYLFIQKCWFKYKKEVCIGYPVEKWFEMLF